MIAIGANMYTSVLINFPWMKEYKEQLLHTSIYKKILLIHDLESIISYIINYPMNLDGITSLYDMIIGDMTELNDNDLDLIEFMLEDITNKVFKYLYYLLGPDYESYTSVAWYHNALLLSNIDAKYYNGNFIMYSIER